MRGRGARVGQGTNKGKDGRETTARRAMRRRQDGEREDEASGGGAGGSHSRSGGLRIWRLRPLRSAVNNQPLTFLHDSKYS